MPTEEQFRRAVEDIRRLARDKPFVAVAVTFSDKDKGYGKYATEGAYVCVRVCVGNVVFEILCGSVHLFVSVINSFHLHILEGNNVNESVATFRGL